VAIDFSQHHCESEEVYHAKLDIFGLSKADIGELMSLARTNERAKVRFCTHHSRSDEVHQMFIVHPADIYVRPHKHIGKSESMLVIEGIADYITFDEYGKVKDVVQMGDYVSGNTFYHTVGPEVFHTLRIRSDWFVFLEVTKGPFIESDTIFGEWSPDGTDLLVSNQYIQTLCCCTLNKQD